MQSVTGAQQAPLLFHQPINGALGADHKSKLGLTYQPRVQPEDGNWLSIDWPQWQFPNPLNGAATSFEDYVNLGLAKPSYALKNAPSYVHFVLCLVFDDFDCFNYISEAVP